MCLCWLALIRSIIAASVVDLPDPVVPVTRMIPRSSSASSPITGGSWSCSTVLISWGIVRMTSETDPRWRKALTRKRARSVTAKARSTSWSASNSARWASLPSSRRSTIACVASGRRGSASGSGWSLPLTRIIGEERTFRWRSEPPEATRWRRAASRSNMSWVSADRRRGLSAPPGCGSCAPCPRARGRWPGVATLATLSAAPPPSRARVGGLKALAARKA